MPDNLVECILEHCVDGIYDLTPARRQIGIVFSQLSRRFVDAARTVMLREVNMGEFDEPVTRPDALDFLTSRPELGCRVRKLRLRAMESARLGPLFELTAGLMAIDVQGNASLVLAAISEASQCAVRMVITGVD